MSLYHWRDYARFDEASKERFGAAAVYVCIAVVFMAAVYFFDKGLHLVDLPH